MRASMIALIVLPALVASVARAHGPQIQLTIDSGKLTTRQVILDKPYSTALAAPKAVYVMPVLPFSNVWYSRPNEAIDPILLQPAFPSGPGLAYGYDLADGGPQAFATDSVISITFTAGLKRWDGATFTDAGSTELKAFRGSNPAISSPAANFAVTSDSGPFDSVSLATVLAGYGADAAEVHGTVRFALLGDGSSPTSASPDGVYLVGLQASTTQMGVSPSDPYYFVLNKNASWSTVQMAVDSLGIGASLQQWTAPECGTCVLCLLGAMCLGTVRPARGNR
jgi:hypothetical protein